jgi:hypothetical protein
MGTACVRDIHLERECVCVCSFVNEAAHKKSGTYSREVAEIHIYCCRGDFVPFLCMSVMCEYVCVDGVCQKLNVFQKG